MDPGAATAEAVMQQQQALYDMAAAPAVGQSAYGDPSAQQQLDGRISYDGSDTQMMAMFGHQFSQHNNPSALLGRKHAPDRRPLRFWQPFNDWWRSELTRLGRRPTSEEIGEWYMEAADRTWGDTKPTLQETRVHAKCLRSLPLVRDYFRNYRAKKKGKGSDGSGYDGEDTGDGDTEDGTDNRGPSRSKQQPKPAGAGPPKRARLAGPANSNPEAAGPSGQGRGSNGGNNSDPGAVPSAMAGAGGYPGLDLMQAYQPQYQPQYWADPSQEEYARQAMLQMQQAALYQQLAAAQQLASGDAQYAFLQQQQAAAAAAAAAAAGAQGNADRAKAAAVALAKAAALSVPEGGGEPVSGAAADDEHMDHEPHSGSGATQPPHQQQQQQQQQQQHRARHPTQADTATSNATSHAAGHTEGAATEEAVSQQLQDKSGSVSRGRTPQHEDSPDIAVGNEATRASAAGAAARVSPAPPVAAPQRQQQLQLADSSDHQPDEPRGRAGSEQPVGQADTQQGAQPMETDQPQAAAGREPAARASLAGAPQQQQQQQPQSAAIKVLRQQLDLGDSSGGGASANGAADRAPQQQQQLPQLQVKTQPAGVVPSHLQAALLSAAAAAAAGRSMSAAAPAVHGPTAVSPYVQGLSAATAAAAAAAAANAGGGLNLADSPQLRGMAAVQQEEPHPGAQLPEAAAAALAAAPPGTGAHPPSRLGEQRAGTPPGADHGGRGISIDIDEAELLNDVEMGGMSHGELVAHIRRVQQELLAKRELLHRSFDQLKRTQERLQRRERKLAKEQQRTKQYQNALETWQSAWQQAAAGAEEPREPKAEEGAAGAAPRAGAGAAVEEGNVAAAPVAAEVEQQQEES